jgi:hypothetical protein
VEVSLVAEGVGVRVKVRVAEVREVVVRLPAVVVAAKEMGLVAGVVEMQRAVYSDSAAVSHAQPVSLQDSGHLG